MTFITPAQLARLQTCCSQMATRVAGFENTREARLAWAAGVLGRPIESFNALTIPEARTLIDAAQGEIGHRAPLKPGSATALKRPATERDARRAGLDGRNDDVEFVAQPEIVSAELLEEIAHYYHRLDWTKARFDAWLASPTSPIRHVKVIRTVAHANRVIWALKNMLKDAGRWADWSQAS